MQQGLLRCSPLLPVWLTRQASCSFPLKEISIFFNGRSSEQQADVLLASSCLLATHCLLLFSSFFYYLMLMLTLTHSFTHSHSLAHQQHQWLSAGNYGILRQGLCWWFAALCTGTVVPAHWKCWFEFCLPISIRKYYCSWQLKLFLIAVLWCIWSWLAFNRSVLHSLYSSKFQ